MAGIKFNRIFAVPNNIIALEIMSKEDADYIKSQSEITLKHPYYNGKYKVQKVTPPNPDFAYNESGHAGFNTNAYFVYLETPFATPVSDMNYAKYGVRWRQGGAILSGKGISYTGNQGWGADDKNQGEITVKAQGQSVVPDGGGTNNITPVNPFENIEQQYETQTNETSNNDIPFYKKKWVIVSGVSVVVIGLAAASYFIFRKKK